MRLCLILILFNISTFCFSQTCLPGFTFMTQNDVDNFAINYPGCTEILGNLYLEPDVYSVQGLSQLQKINGFLDIYQNYNIENLDGLQNIDTLGELFLFEVTELTDLIHFDNLEHVSNNIYLGELPKLINLDFPKLKHIDGQLKLIDIEILDSLKGFDSLKYLSEIELINLNGLEAIATFNTIDTLEVLDIRECDVLVDLDGLSSIKWIESNFYLDHLNLLDDISFFDSLIYAGNMYINFCPSLEVFNGFNSIDSMNWLGIENNINLTSFGHFDSLLYVDGFIYFQNNPKLVDISGLTSIRAINGRIHIVGNSILENITGLVNIDGSTISASYSDADLTIKDNPLLSACSIKSICEAFDNPNLNYLIDNNKTNCNSAIEILDNCCPDSLIIDWHPVLTGTYKSSGNIYYETDILSANQDIILSHGVDSAAYLPSSLIIEQNATLDIQDSGCNN